MYDKNFIWEPREETFETLQYELTGDNSWIKDIVPRTYDLKGFMPFMISNNGELVCIPKLGDMPSVLLTGGRSSGKTSILSSMLSTAYFSMGYRCCCLNDMTRETFTWHRKMNSPAVVNGYKSFRTPKYLPIVHVLFMSKDLTLPDFRMPSWKTCLPFKDIVDNPEEYLSMDNTASAHHLSSIKDKFNFNGHSKLTLDEIEEIIKNNLEEKFYNPLVVRIKRLYDDGILDVCPENKGADSKVLLKFKNDTQFIEFNVLTGIMAVGGVPILHTDNILNRPRFGQKYLNNQLMGLIEDQENHPYFRKNKLAVFIDELTTLSFKGRNGENPIIRQLVAQGRPKGIGSFYCTQNPSKMEDAVLSNTRYFISCSNTLSEAKVLTKEFSLEDRYATIITNLDKSYHECVAYTQDKFAVFNPAENSFYYNSGPFVGAYVMSPLLTQPPRSEEKS